MDRIHFSSFNTKNNFRPDLFLKYLEKPKVNQFLSHNQPLTRTGAVWLSESVHLSKTVLIHIIRLSFTKEFTILLSQVKERSDFCYDLQMSQFLSYNQPPNLKMLEMG